ncbi:MAG: CDP-diacylglycerol O-phosphatidyltransferase [Deltaproteobacteria bacterium]|nr:CDP-diacylglycerol O-phosphatidyltransferase [Deltaproteobacteria bacterium]
MPTDSFVKYCAWAIHLYTATGAITAIIALDRIARGDFRGALIVMAIALFVDSTDGPFARSLNVRARLPFFDGSLLDNVLDYLNYVAVPVFFMIRSGIVSDHTAGLAVASFIMVASAYAFCRIDAKTVDHYFRGFPSYWNLAAFYLFCLRLPVMANIALLIALAVMEFLPIKFIYPNRTAPLRSLTLTLAFIWAVVTALMLPGAPSYNPLLLFSSLAFVVYYFVMSFALYFHPGRLVTAPTGTQAQHGG